MAKRTLILTLQTFSAPGGIQKMSRTLSYAFDQISRENEQVELWSLYDRPEDHDARYIAAANFKAFSKNKALFTLSAFRAGASANRVVLTHVNLSLVGWLIKMVNPTCKVWLIAHGIEVWRPLRLCKKAVWKFADRILCVSKYTLQKIKEYHAPDDKKCIVVNNALDPFMTLPETFDKPVALLKKYKLDSTDQVIFTLTRLATTERYKGYEQVLNAVSRLKTIYPDVKYILAGPYDEQEKKRVDELVGKLDISKQVFITGYLSEDALTDHFLLADVFVLPSKKEGFGIVFIEAQACGLQVICGNEDGSLDAIRNGELGIAVNPNSPAQLDDAIKSSLQQSLTASQRKHIQQKSIEHFNAWNYQQRLRQLMDDEQNG